MAAISPLAAARHLCERSDWSLTNLQLQKMLYLAQMFYMGKRNGDRLVNGSFEAWDLGPVSPEVYRQVKSFGGNPIRHLLASPVRDDDRAKMLDAAVRDLSHVPASQLVNITHRKDGAWARNYVPNRRGVVIPDQDILAEYKTRFPAG